MKNRYNRPIKLSDTLQKINNKLVNKFGKIEYIIYSKWDEIVGIFLFQYSEPDKITSIIKTSESNNNQYKERILNVNVVPSVAIEFQHFENKILEKINSFFGYQAIHRIRIHQKISLNKIHKLTYKKTTNNTREEF